MDNKHIVIATDNLSFKNYFCDFFNQEEFEITCFVLNNGEQSDIDQNTDDTITVNPMDKVDVRNAIDRISLNKGAIDTFVLYSNLVHLDYFSNEYEQLLGYWDYKVLGCLRLMREVAENMKASNNGSMINIINLQSRFPKLDDAIALSADMAILNLTKGVAADLINYGIKCNSISLGNFEFNKFDQKENDFIPIKRSGKPIELMHVIQFLSAHDNQYLVGDNINLDGGYSRQL